MNKTENCETRTSLFDCLQERKYLTLANVRVLKAFADKWGCSPLQAIIDTNLMTEGDVANALAAIFQIDRVWGLRNHRIDDKCLNLLGFREAKDRAMVLLTDESGRYDLVTADPSDRTYITGLKKKSPVQFTLAVGERSDIVRAIDEKYPLGAQLPTIIGR